MQRFALYVLVLLSVSSAKAATIETRPSGPYVGGDVFQVRVMLGPGDHVAAVTCGGAGVSWYESNHQIRALCGVALDARAGVRPVTVSLTNGSFVSRDVVIGSQVQEVRAMPAIPQKLGGNTVTAEKHLVSTLAQENTQIAGLFSQPKCLWKVPFRPPVKDPIVTDTYGYQRKGSASSITHKGTDYRAKVGTPIYAMNRGIIRLKKKFSTYGNTIVVDHGVGVLTYYMHLSKAVVHEGQLVKKGQLIGYSGDTGYAEKPHLHLTVRVHDVSVDPEKFLSLMGE